MPKRQEPGQVPVASVLGGEDEAPPRPGKHPASGGSDHTVAQDLSEDDGTPSAIRAVASWLRRDGQSTKGNNMRPEQSNGKVARPATAPATAEHNPVPAPASTSIAKQAVSYGAGVSWGSNSQLPHSEVTRAILERIQSTSGGSHSRTCPTDILSFLQKATIVFLDQQGRPVEFDRVVVAWDE